MSDMRLGPWAVFGLGVVVSTVACVDGSVSAGPGAPESVSLGGSSGVSNALAAGASGKSNPSAAGASGALVASCTAPQVSCGGVCVDLTSVAHCGTCEQACAAGQSCFGWRSKRRSSSGAMSST